MSYHYYYTSGDSSSDSDAESSECAINEEMDTASELHSGRSGGQSSSNDVPIRDASDGHPHGPGSTLLPSQFSASNSGSNSSFTSYEESPSTEGRSPSPTASVIPLSAALEADMYKEEYGRSLTTYSEIYRFPADTEEWGRQKKLHYVLIDLMGTKYPPPMIQIMTSTVEGERACLDLGGGNGCWIKEVARDFPNCRAVAVDLVPIVDTRDMPPNLWSEVDDINLGLQHFFGAFDVVHSRLISSGIKDYQLLIENIARVLRPGGLIEVGESDYHVYDAQRRCIQMTSTELGPPWWARWMTFMRDAISQSRGDIGAATHLLTWIKNHEAFENVVYREVWITITPADHNPNEPLYPMLKDYLMTFLRSGRPLLLGSGLSEEALNILEGNAIRELREETSAQYMTFQCVYARRNNVVLD